LDDLIIGAIWAGKEKAGKSYVVFGKKSGAAIDLSAIDLVSGVGVGGFVINGENADDFSGWSVSSAGDVNGDGKSFARNMFSSRASIKNTNNQII
jgi:hypothetical protein